MSSKLARPRRYRHGGKPNQATADILENGRRFTDSRGQSYRKFGGTVVREQ